MYPRNNATTERIAIGQVVLISDGTIQTASVVITVRGQGGAEATGGGTTAYGAEGTVYYTPTQAETNYTSFVVIASKASCFSSSQTIITTAAATSGEVRLEGVTHTGAVIPTVTTLTNLPAITANWLTATGIAASALDGKGNWNIGKTGYSLTQTFPANFSDFSIEVTTGKVFVKLTDTCTANTDMRGNDATPLDAAGIRAAVGLASANTDTQFAASATATGFSTHTAADVRTEMDANSTQLASIGITKNAIFNNLEFLMVDATDHVTPEVGLTVTGQMNIDGGVFASLNGAIAEVSNGIYKADLTAADTNGDVITYRFSATGAADRFITIKTRA